MIGTPEYMSPEQAEAKEVDERADIYSLGVILYEMVTGRLPFEGETPLSVAMKHKGEAPKDPREFNAVIPEDLSRIILKCLEKEKNNRYQNAADLRTALESKEKNIPTTTRAVTAPKRTGSKEITVTLGVRKILVPALVLVGLIVAVVVILQFLPERGAKLLETAQTSVAVLPFEDLSLQQDQAIFCEGFSESLINALFKIRELRIPARTSSFPFKEKEWSYAQIGERLNVGTVLEGSVQKAGDSLRIIVRLVQVSDESILWSDKYSGTLDDVFSVQDEIALKIVENLKLRLAGAERTELTRRHTTSVEAYELYLKGRYFRWREIRENFFKAKDCFEQAIAIDPGYAAAFSGLAEVYMLLGIFSHIPRDEAASQAKQAARKALELDPNSAEVRASLGVILEVFDWDWEGAEREFIGALELNPNCFEAHYEYGFLLYRLMRLDSAESHFLEALRIDPLAYRAYDYLGGVYELKGENEKAKEMDDKSRELYDPAPDEEDPIVRIQQWFEREGRRPASLRALARAYINAGERDKADKILDEMMKQAGWEISLTISHHYGSRWVTTSKR
jgi:pentatricopeptide repeat protein